MFRIPVTTQEPLHTSADPAPRRRINGVQSGLGFIIAPTGKVWDIRAITVRLATDATVINRQLVFRMDVPGLVHPTYSEPFFDAALYQPASTTRYYSWAKGVDYSVRTGTAYDGETHPLPDNLLYTGMSYQFGLENGQAGDGVVICYHGYEVDI